MPGKKPVPEDLTLEERLHLSIWFHTTWPHHFKERSVRGRYLRMQVDAALDWARANGKRYIDYPAFLRNWIRKDMKHMGYQPHDPPSSKPSPRGKRPFERVAEMEAAGPLFKGFRNG